MLSKKIRTRNTDVITAWTAIYRVQWLHGELLIATKRVVDACVMTSGLTPLEQHASVSIAESRLLDCSSSTTRGFYMEFNGSTDTSDGANEPASLANND